MLTFPEIDTLRVKHGLTRKAVYERAGVNGETWRRLRMGAHSPNTRTLMRLTDALDALIAERAARCAQKVNCEPEGGLSQSQLQEGRA